MTLTRLESESQIISTPSSDDTQTTRKRTASNLPGAPTIGQVLVRPRWIGALLLAVAVAGGFAWLANWQLESALMNQSIEQQDSEAIVPLESVSQPGSPVGEDAGGRVVTVEGTFAPEDFGVVGNRVNGEENGYWVVGHLITSAAEPANLAVALGWTATEDEAKAAVIDAAAATTAASVPTKIEGRYQPPEGPAVPDTTDNPLVVRSLSPAQQANLWHEVDGNVLTASLWLMSRLRVRMPSTRFRPCQHNPSTGSTPFTQSSGLCLPASPSTSGIASGETPGSEKLMSLSRQLPTHLARRLSR